MEVSEYIVKRLGTRAGRRTERSNIQITREIFERMSLTPYIASIPVVHVAGTKGKGTTSALTAELLRKAHNYKSVALFQSPHLVDIRERVLINNQFIEEKMFLSLFKNFEEEYDLKCDSIFDREDQNTPERDRSTPAPVPNSGEGVFKDRSHFFRSMFVFSVYVMKQLAVEAAVIEVGIGGRLDPTNIIPPPTCCIVTCLGMDHCDLLGNTIEQIASEKGGIYKRGSVCFSAPQNDYPQTRSVLEKLCREQAEQEELLYPDAMKDFCGMSHQENKTIFKAIEHEKGAHMVENAALALAAARVVGAKKWKSIGNDNLDNNVDKSSSVVWKTQDGSLSAIEKEVISKFKLEGRSHKLLWSRSCRNNNNNNNDDNVEKKQEQQRTTFLIDGAHTVESVRRAVQWALGLLVATDGNNNNTKLTIVFGTSRPPGPQLEEIMKMISSMSTDGFKIAKFVFINIPELVSGRTSAEKCIEYVTNENPSLLSLQNNTSDNNNNNNNTIPFDTADCVESALTKLTTQTTDGDKGKEQSSSDNSSPSSSSSSTVLVVGSMYSAGGALRWLRSNGTCVE